MEGIGILLFIYRTALGLPRGEKERGTVRAHHGAASMPGAQLQVLLAKLAESRAKGPCLEWVEDHSFTDAAQRACHVGGWRGQLPLRVP